MNQGNSNTSTHRLARRTERFRCARLATEMEFSWWVSPLVVPIGAAKPSTTVHLLFRTLMGQPCAAAGLPSDLSSPDCTELDVDTSQHKASSHSKGPSVGFHLLWACTCQV